MSTSRRSLPRTAMPCGSSTAGDEIPTFLIHGGPASTYAAVRAWLERLTPAEHRIELFVVTHIDADHIDGAILLLQEFRALGLSFEDIWFNGWRHLQENTPRDDVFAPIQGEFLGALIEGGRLPWNAAFRSAAVVVPETEHLPSRQLPGGASLTLLSPQQRQLRLVEAQLEHGRERRRVVARRHGRGPRPSQQTAGLRTAGVPASTSSAAKRTNPIIRSPTAPALRSPSSTKTLCAVYGRRRN